MKQKDKDYEYKAVRAALYSVVTLTTLAIGYLSFSFRNYKSAREHLENNTVIQTSEVGEEFEKRRDFPLFPKYFDSVKSVYQMVNNPIRYVVKSEKGEAIFVKVGINGGYTYKRDKNLDGIIDSEGLGRYWPLTGDTSSIREWGVKRVISYPSY